MLSLIVVDVRSGRQIASAKPRSQRDYPSGIVKNFARDNDLPPLDDAAILRLSDYQRVSRAGSSGASASAGSALLAPNTNRPATAAAPIDAAAMANAAG